MNDLQCISLAVSGLKFELESDRDLFYRCFVCGGKCDFFLTLGVEDSSGRHGTEFQACSGHIDLVNRKIIGTSRGDCFDETRDYLV